MAKTMLSTVDNPYNPFTHFDEWYEYDLDLARRENRPDCCSYLARMSMESDDVSEAEQDEINEMVIDDIVKLNLNGKFIKITQNDQKAAEKDE
jgi:hypothetical protein